jgi:quercetin dioxygenase-like cupin family protein
MTIAETMRAVSIENPAVASQSQRPVGRVVRPGEGRRVRAFGNEIEFMLSGDQTGESLTVGLATVPTGNGPPPHVHDAEDELFLILEGEYRVDMDGETTTVGPGTVVYLPRGTVHTFKVVSETPGRHWTLQNPSGFERYFTRAAEIFAVPGPPDVARLAAITEEYGARFVPPIGGRPGAK